MQQNLKITPEVVRKYKEPTAHFLCSLSKSKGVLQFTHFVVRDVDQGDILFDLAMEDEELSDDISEKDRIMSYQFCPDYFQRKTIGITKIFKTGPKPLKNLLMIEKFYFKKQLISSYEFKFPFCIPKSTNTWEQIYNLPILSDNLKQQMILNSWESKSDIFYFIEDELLMHQKIDYDYNCGQDEVD